MQFFRRATGKPARLGILSGTFHPPTRAHLALARAGLEVTDEVLFVLPRVFPHKTYEAVGFTERLTMLEAALAGEPRFSIATTEGGLFVEIARECRTAYGAKTQLKFLCGRDAAQRVVIWDYGEQGAFREMLREFELLVADRKGVYEPPPDMEDRIHRLSIGRDYNDISGSDVRGRIAHGEAWEHLVPEAIVPLVRELYKN